ncbi:MAG TPA: isoleucine--tRNA ligase [Phycisphaerae bacterium]|nr:isoleucine--tRNA ligase [Phycisphaerae bacterium]
MFKPVSPQFDFPKAEQEVLRFWEENGIYEKSLKQREGRPEFVFYEGPPTANGLPHPGHCLTRVMKDLFPRYKTMCGYYCHRKAGWDTHGLPVEVEVCKELGLGSKQDIERYGVEPFVHKCIESVFRYTREWEELTRRLGFWINLEEAYVTYHQSYVESVWWALKTLFDRGLLYQGHKVVWWWPQGGTALSAGEVGQGYKLIDDPSITVRFRLRKQFGDSVPERYARGHTEEFRAKLGLDADVSVSFLAWTTTPWTLPSNVALAVREDVDYAVVRHTDGEVFILAKDLVGSVFHGLPVDVEKDLEIIKGDVKGDELVGLRYEPLFDYEPYPKDDVLSSDEKSGTGDPRIPHWQKHILVPAEFVTLEQGTGIVHMAPAFGEDDYKVGQRWNLVFLQYLNPDGTFVSEATDFAGRFCKEADGDIIANLKQRGLLLKREQVKHEYPFCWRADDEPLIQYARRSWFVRTTQFVEQFLANNRRINWLPEHIRDGRFGNFLETNVDWALSRERYWGTPLPIWQCETTGYQEAVATYDELLAKPDVQGTEVWQQAKQSKPDLPDDLRVHKPYIDAITYQSPKDPSARMRRVTEVIDCWFDAGSMPFAQWGYPHTNRELFRQRFPGDFISEAIDQTRGWFYTLLAISTMLFGPDGADQDDDTTFEKEFPHPFRNCIVLGLIMGEDGKKLSKRLRNYKDPSDIFDREGADAMRWAMLSAQAPWTSVRFQERAIAEYQREFLIRLYNVYSFFVIYANIDGFDPAKTSPPEPSSLSELDRWILSELHGTIRDVRTHMDRFENHPAGQRMVEFVDALSNWYVRRSRARFWKSEHDQDKANAYQTLWTCLEAMCRLAAPFVPFFAESLYQNLVGTPFGEEAKQSVHLCDYPAADESLIDQELSDEMVLVRQIVSLGHSARTQAGVKVRQPLALVELVLADPSRRTWLEDHNQLIAEELNVKRVEFAADAQQYVDYQLKPNFKSIGPKYGKLAPKIKESLFDLDPTRSYTSLVTYGKIGVQAGGEQVDLTQEDVQVTLSAKEGWTAAQGRDAVVVLSTGITQELREEGMTREFVHHVQNARKQRDLDYTDRIHLRTDCSAHFQGIIAKPLNKDFIESETLTTDVQTGSGSIGPGEGFEVEIEGESVRFDIEKAE